MPLRLGIIGHPIAHSISPVFQQAALDHLSIDGVYEKWDVSPGDVGPFLEGLRAPGTLGINVTVPHKEAVAPFLDEVDDWASAAGAVNTIVNREGRLTGHNTDGVGFLRALKDGGGFDVTGRRVLILGAGGAARGVVLALARVGAGSLVIANRTEDRARRLAELSQRNGVPATAAALSEADDAAGAADLIVNCTTVGMSHGPDESGSPLSAGCISASCLVNDLVYNPLETPLLRDAAHAGAAVLGGIQMLVYQGAASFEMWTGQPAPVPVMLGAAAAEMESRRR